MDRSRQEKHRDMDRSQQEFLIDRMKELKEREFRAVLGYYNIEIQKRSIRCFRHDDKHFGSCVFYPGSGKAYCHVCQRPIDSVDVVRHEEGLDNLDAAKKVWVDILGNPMPPGEYDDGLPSIATGKELAFIGLAAAGGGTAEKFVNACPRCDAEKGAESSEKAWKGAVVVKDCLTRHPPLLRLLETDPEAASAILEGKADETVRYYESLDRDLSRDGSELHDLMKGRPLREVDGLRGAIAKNLRKARAIRKNVRNR